MACTSIIVTSTNIIWDAKPVDITADDAVGDGEIKGRERGEQAEVKKFLHGMLATGESIAASKIIDEGKEQGFSKTQLWRASRDLRVKKKKLADGWYWALPM